MILRQLRDIKNDTDDILVYGFDGTNNQKISTDINGKLDIVSVNLDIALSTLKTVLDNIDANTDTLEAKTQSIRDQLDVTLSTRASESTAQDILNALGVFSGTNILSELQNLTTSGLATDATLIQVRDYLDTVEIKLQDIINRLDVNLSTRASETTLSSVLSQLDITLSALRDAIKGANNKDFSTLEADIESILAQLDVDLSTRASESTLQSLLNAVGEVSGTNLLTELQSILSQLDVALSTRASEATLLLVKSNLDDVKTKLDTLLAIDFATEATSVEIRDTIGQESGVTVLSRLLDIWNKLVELFNTGVAKVKIWDGTETADVIPDTGINRLAVDVNQAGGVALQRFTPYINFDTSSILLNTSTDTTLFSTSGDGQIDFISIAGSVANYEVAIIIDGIEIVRITMSELGSDLGLSNSSVVSIWADTANRNFRLRPFVPFDFTTSFEIKVKATSTPLPTVNWLIQWRLLV